MCRIGFGKQGASRPRNINYNYYFSRSMGRHYSLRRESDRAPRLCSILAAIFLATCFARSVLLPAKCASAVALKKSSHRWKSSARRARLPLSFRWTSMVCRWYFFSPSSNLHQQKSATTAHQRARARRNGLQRNRYSPANPYLACHYQQSWRYLFFLLFFDLVTCAIKRRLRCT
jgi:hypothetical protein